MNYLFTFHGGSKKSDWNNIHAFKSDGDEANPSKVLNKKGVNLRELRGLTFGPNGNLYVANAYKKYSQILVFDGTLSEDGQYNFNSIFTEPDKESNPGLDHPFQISFGPDGNLYVASQNTDCILRYYGPNATEGNPGNPMPLPSALQGLHQTFYPGTFIPQASNAARGLTSVRGFAFGKDNNFFVADMNANIIYEFDATTAAFKKEVLNKTYFGELNRPDHLLFNEDLLYVGNAGNDTVICFDPYSSSISVNTFVNNESGNLNGPSGMCFTTIEDDPCFLLGSRNTNRILQYTIKNGKVLYDKSFAGKLDDSPEFALVQ